MFGKIAAFELRYQLRQPIFWIAGLIFFLLVFGSVTIDQIQIGSGGNIHKNSPVAIGQTNLIMASSSCSWPRPSWPTSSCETTRPATGRSSVPRGSASSTTCSAAFTGSFIAVALAFLFVPLGIFLGSLAPWVDHETLGPNRLSDYAFAYFWLALPTLFLISAMFFALATATRSMMATYVGVAGFLVAYLLFNALMREPERRQIAALIEPFGMAAFGLARAISLPPTPTA